MNSTIGTVGLAVILGVHAALLAHTGYLLDLADMKVLPFNASRSITWVLGVATLTTLMIDLAVVLAIRKWPFVVLLALLGHLGVSVYAFNNLCVIASVTRALITTIFAIALTSRCTARPARFVRPQPTEFEDAEESVTIHGSKRSVLVGPSRPYQSRMNAFQIRDAASVGWSDNVESPPESGIDTTERLYRPQQGWPHSIPSEDFIG